MPIMFVHGRSQEAQDPQHLHSKWRDALSAAVHDATGDSIDPSSYFPYYAEVLASHWRGGPSRSRDAGIRGASKSEEGDLFRIFAAEYDQIVEVRARASGLGQGGGNQRLTRAERDAAPRSVVSPLRGLQRIAPGAAEVVMWTLRDVASYLQDADAHETVQEQVAASYEACALQAKEDAEPIVVVGHSLGSVVAHDFLSQLEPNTVDLFLTLGSPLGVESIRKRLRGDRKWPRSVKTWINASDSRDLVAIIPAFGRSNIFKEDCEADRYARADVLNLIDVNNDTDNHHSITGYLGDIGVARVIARALNAKK